MLYSPCLEGGCGDLGKVYSSRDIIKKLKQAGWRLVRVAGDHYQFAHDKNPNTTTVPHPTKELNKSVIASISRLSGLEF